MPTKAHRAAGALETAVQNQTGGFREGVTVEAVDDLTPDRGFREKALGFLAGGMTEARNLMLDTQSMGARETAKRELAKEREYIQEADSRTGKLMRAGQTGSQLVGVMLTITLAAAIGFVGTKVISEIDGSIETTEGTKYDNASDSIAGGFADAMGLTDIVFLVLMFAVILGALLAFRARR